ncbi:MAG: DUF1573 domain-containing protein [Planctomycetales bacterium]|nr:DUF1573 domain-containing protein [Planctomycetales bacterium]
MIRRVALFALVFSFLTAGAHAQEWADKMFKIRTHNFGTVARNSQQVFRFELQNIYKETVHISGVRASCGCTTPSVEKNTLATWENGAVVARFNTDSFLGQKSATLTVTIDQPFQAEVQLQVSGYIRSDVVLSPGAVEFGEVEPGTVPERKIQLTYAGRGDWQVEDIRSANDHLQVSMQPTGRGNGRVSYELTVRLKEDAPAGYINDYLHIVTNEGRNPIPLAVSGRVTPAVTISPASLFLGVIEPGRSVTRQLIVRAKKPFRIVNIHCDDKCFAFAPSDEAKPMHILPVTFTADQAGKIACTIAIETDLPGGSAEFVASATVNNAQTASNP